MKKLMVAAVAGLFAVAANAAAMNWATGMDYTDPAGNIAGGEGYITMYLFQIDKTAYDTLTAGGESGVSAAAWSTYGSQLAGADATYVDDGMGQMSIADTRTFGVGDTAYAAIIMAYDEGTGITHYKGNVAAYTYSAAADMTVENLDTFIGGTAGSQATALEWAAVPEPTSGLLLLLGVAGLALKRKRA